MFRPIIALRPVLRSQPEPIMSESPSLIPPSLIMLQFLAWVADRPRTYADTMAAWRSTCPRLSVWEDALIDGLVRVENEASRPVTLTPRGRTALRQNAEAL